MSDTKISQENLISESPLSIEFMVATEIFHCEVKGKLPTYTELCLLLPFPEDIISTALDILLDWGIVKAEYGEIESGRASMLLKVSNESYPIIKQLYENYWKDRRQEVGCNF